MPQLIRPQNVSVVTKDGELQVNITLELNVNLNANGGLDVSATAADVKAQKVAVEEPKNFEWAIPDFGETPKIKFGKEE